MMKILDGAIGCDVHPSVPGIQILLPYPVDYGRDIVEVRGMDGSGSRAYPPLVPAGAQPDWR